MSSVLITDNKELNSISNINIQEEDQRKEDVYFMSNTNVEYQSTFLLKNNRLKLESNLNKGKKFFIVN